MAGLVTLWHNEKGRTAYIRETLENIKISMISMSMIISIIMIMITSTKSIIMFNITIAIQ